MPSPEPEDDPECVGECTYLPRQVERRDADGQLARFEIDWCAGCGRVYACRPLTPPPPSSGPGSTGSQG